MARVLSIAIAIVASVLVFAASVLAVAALLFFRSGGDGSSAAAPTGAIPGRTDSATVAPSAGSGGTGPGGGSLGAPSDGRPSPGPGATCEPVAGRGFDVAATGAGPGDQVTVAVDLVDDTGAHHPQLVPAGAADAQGRVTASLPATLNGRPVQACTVTAVQLGDRVVFAGR